MVGVKKLVAARVIRPEPILKPRSILLHAVMALLLSASLFLLTSFLMRGCQESGVVAQLMSSTSL